MLMRDFLNLKRQHDELKMELELVRGLYLRFPNATLHRQHRMFSKTQTVDLILLGGNGETL